MGTVNIIAHNNGLVSNVHFYEILDGIKEEAKCKPVRTGPTIAENIGELNERSLTYFNDHQSTRLFPPTYYLEGDIIKQFVDKVNQLPWLENPSIKILTNYNPADHLTLLGFSGKDKMEIICQQQETYENVVMIINPKERWLIVNVVIDNVADPKTLQAEMDKGNGILKTLHKTKNQKTGDGHMTLIGVMVCPQYKEEDLNLDKLPFLNQPLSTFVTEKEWYNDGGLEKKLKFLVNESKQQIKSYCGAISRSTDILRDFQVFTGQLMASMAQRSLFLPKVTDDLEKKIDTILMNNEQIESINNPTKWKIINGGFGSGKTVVLNEIAWKMITQDEIGAICYLPFAPYSLIDQKFAESFRLLCKIKKVDYLNFKLKSFCLQSLLAEIEMPLTDFYDLTSHPKKNVAVILKHLKTKYCSDGKSMAILIDEFPREFVDTNYANHLAECLEEHFQDITVVISFQSVEKTKEYEINGKLSDISKNMPNISGMQEFKLGKTMRMSLDNFELNNILKREIELTKHVTPLEYSRTTFFQAFSEKFTPFGKKNSKSSKKSSSLNQKVKVIESTPSFSGLEQHYSPEHYSPKEDFVGTKKSSTTKDQSSAGSFSKGQSSSSSSILNCETFRLHDTELLRHSPTVQTKGKIVHSINTKITFTKTTCGHTISSKTKPKLLHMPRQLAFYKSCQLNVCLSFVLEHCIKDAQKTVIICTSKQQMKAMKLALVRINKSPRVYIPYLLGSLPSNKQKSEIIEALSDKSIVLLTDYRSFRGCETEKCIMLIDLNSTIGPNLYVEILTRSVAYLDILVIPIIKGTSKVMQKVLAEWKRHKLVTESFVHMKLKKRNTIDVTISEPDGKKMTSRQLKQEDIKSFTEQMIETINSEDDHAYAIQ